MGRRRDVRALIAVLLVCLTVLAGCTNNDEKDSDGDGLTDAEERQGWQLLVVETMEGRFFITTSSDLNKVDTDGDGLDDFDEFFLRTDPRNPDSDGDGLSDCQEERHSVRSECEDPDFKGPYDNGTNTHPMKADSDPGPSRFKDRFNFTDETATLRPNDILFGDGLSDYDEWMGITIQVNGGTRVVRPDPRMTDTDNDGLEDGEEILVFGSDPTVFDTDGDGCRDGLDPLPTYEQTYRLQGLTFENKGGATDLVLDVWVEGGNQRIERNGVAAGATVTLDEIAVKPSGCSRSPLHPYLDLVIFASDSGAGKSLDITSGSTLNGQAGSKLSWNVRTGALSWGVDEAPLVTPLRLHGADGALGFSLATK